MDGDGERTSLQEDVAEVLRSRDQGSFVRRLSVVDQLAFLLSRQHGVAQREQLKELVTILKRVHSTVSL